MMTLIIGDTSAEYFAYPYDGATGAVGPRRVFGDTSDARRHARRLDVDADGGLWCALVRWRASSPASPRAGLDRTVALPVANPTDVTFGGADLDRLYVTSVGAGPDGDGLDGALLVIDGLDERGRLEPRFS